MFAEQAIQMSLFHRLKTGNVILDTITTTAVFTIITYLVKGFYEVSRQPDDILHSISLDNFKYWFYKKNTIIMTGKKCSSIAAYYCTPTVSSVFGDRFKAVWNEIIVNIDKNDTIHEIKDFLTMSETPLSQETENNTDVFIVSQRGSFLFHRELGIYARTKITSEEAGDKEKGTANSKIENIEIALYSYTASLHQMKQYIDDLTERFLENIEKHRNHKRFIYTLIKTRHEESRFECWKESCFQTTRSFDNMFFEQKATVLEKLDFFLNNRDWYFKKGIPYTIGFGLHGPPGTGKTSFIKSLAKYTNRHVVVLSLKLIKTRLQLQNFFYEDRYNEYNKKRSVGFDKKIIVIEDIDAQGAIVLDRSKKATMTMLETQETILGDVIKNLLVTDNANIHGKGKGGDDKVGSCIGNKLDASLVDEPITLDDIINLWDGIEETGGRILVISSNRYRDLDSAITRPGRIDVSIEMNNVSRTTLAEMYRHLYESDIDPKALALVQENFYSPAEIINLYLMYRTREREFIERLITNQKLC